MNSYIYIYLWFGNSYRPGTSKSRSCSFEPDFAQFVFIYCKVLPYVWLVDVDYLQMIQELALNQRISIDVFALSLFVALVCKPRRSH